MRVDLVLKFEAKTYPPWNGAVDSSATMSMWTPNVDTQAREYQLRQVKAEIMDGLKCANPGLLPAFNYPLPMAPVTRPSESNDPY